jgi:hypothetical protein
VYRRLAKKNFFLIGLGPFGLFTSKRGLFFPTVQKISPVRGSTPFPTSSTQASEEATRLEEGGRAVGSEDLLADGLGNAVGKGELEVLGEELLDVGAADVLGLLNLDDLDDLQGVVSHTGKGGNFVKEVTGWEQGNTRPRGQQRTWIERKRARWRAAMSW